MTAATSQAETTGTTTNAHPGRRALVLALMVLAALALRWPLLSRSVWFDEACMSDQRIGTWAQLVATLYVDIHPPLFVTFMHVWNGLFGDGELALRMPALLSGLACIPLTFWTGRRLVGDRAAMWAALLLTLSPVHVWYCAEARLYTPMLMCTLLAFGTFDRLLDPAVGKTRGLLLLHVANVAVMLALHYYLGVVVVALAVLAPVVARGLSPMAVRILLWHGIGVLLLGGFVLAKQALGEFETSQHYLRALDLKELGHFLFGWCWTGDTLAAADAPLVRAAASAQRWIGAALLALGCVQVVRGRRRHPRAWLVLVGMLLLPAFLMACAALGYDRTYLERTLIAALPFVFLLAATGMAALPGRLPDVTGSAAAAFAVAGLAALYAYGDTRWTVYKPNGDWRSATAWLGAEIDAGGAGRPVFTSTPNPRSLSYYDVRIQDVKNLRAPMSAAAIGDKVRQRLGAFVGDLAERTFRDFAAHNDALLLGAKLRVYRAAPTPAQLPMPADRPDDVCYLVRDRWHPPDDDSVERLLEDPGVELLEQHDFTGIRVYEVRIPR